MKIYKFKDLTDEKNHPHFYQIIRDGTIWCAKPDSLNDEDEFKFKLDYTASAHTTSLLSQVLRKNGTKNYSPINLDAIVRNHKELEIKVAPSIANMINNCRSSIGITSFSITKNDDHLWNEYGGKGNGVCIEINIPYELIGKSFHRVHYVPERIIHVDTFLEADLSDEGAKKLYQDILFTKIKKWSQEEEIRFIGKHYEENFTIDAYISEVTFGAQVPRHTFKQVMANIANHCRIKNIKITKLK